MVPTWIAAQIIWFTDSRRQHSFICDTNQPANQVQRVCSKVMAWLSCWVIFPVICNGLFSKEGLEIFLEKLLR
jgi:hypothetical protein